MKETSNQSPQKRAFTIVELLTVMAVITLLVGLLLPSLRAVRRQAKQVKQKSQMHAIDVSLEMFKNDAGDYPDSDRYDSPPGEQYGGALRLAEAMIGQDFLGMHVDSAFRSDGLNSAGTEDLYDTALPGNLDSRQSTYLDLENANAYKMASIYSGLTGVYPDLPLLCDVFGRVNNRTGTPRKIGMPILYYKAHTQKKLHDPNDNANDYANNIYNYDDNIDLLNLGAPPTSATDTLPFTNTAGDSRGSFSIGIGNFYDQTENPKITTMHWPYNAETFILISAGFDGKYGTPDDIQNFDY